MTKITVKFLIGTVLLSLLSSCFSAKKDNFASNTPVKKIVFDAPFPVDLIYQATPDAKVIVGKKKIEPTLYEISGYEVSSGAKLWQLPFQGEVIGQTEKQILVYEEKTSTVHFITPQDGQITRKVSPAPNPLTSKNSLETGMAFTDDVYLTTKALYTSIWNNPNSQKEDDSFKIGVTAKSWDGNETKWFVPPVKQIVIVENRPVILGDKVLIINPPQSHNGVQSYQIVSLKTGEELYRGNTDGLFSYIAKDTFIERTASLVRRIEPLTGKEIWKVSGDFSKAHIATVANQLTIAVPSPGNTRTVKIIEADSGVILKEFELTDMQETSFKAAFLAKDNQLLLNFDSALYDVYDKANYNYWVAYDSEAKKPLWRTDFNSQSLSSLLPFAADKLQIRDND